MSRTLALPTVVALAVLSLAGCGGDASADVEPTPSGPATVAVTGTVTVDGETSASGTDRTCITDGGYSDVALGAQVVVSDESGKTIALGKLAGGRMDADTAASIPWTASAGRSVRCTFQFRVDDVPAGRDFYGVEVTHRGVLQYSADDLAEPLALTLG